MLFRSELKGKMGPQLSATAAGGTNAEHHDISQALLALGYNEKEASAALKGLPADLGVSEGIKWALRQLAR